MLKIATVVGARPQFVKSSTISRILGKQKDIREIIIHTGQHYDKNMSDIFFTELEIPQPDYNLGVGSATHAVQTARILEKTEKVLLDESPDLVMVYGDTNSTIAGALAASKLHMKTAHVEAGLRSYNRKMPEEINRIVTDHISNMLFAPTVNAMQILKKEGLGNISYYTGDVMYDSFLFMKNKAENDASIQHIVPDKPYYLCTIHRQENTDDPRRLQQLFDALSSLDLPVVLPVHPRTKKYINELQNIRNVIFFNPLSYKEMLLLLKHAKKVLTDSGGLQKEAYFMQKPCITLRDETEWIETLDNNWNIVVGTNKDKILQALNNEEYGKQNKPYGIGRAAEKIIQLIHEILNSE